MSLISARDAAIGKRIAEIRESRGFTQAALAAAVGESKYVIVNIELGRRRVSFEDLERLAAALHCRVYDFRMPVGSLIPRRSRGRPC